MRLPTLRDAVEHHGLTGYSSCTSPEVFLSWVAANTERARIGHGGVQTAKGVNRLVRVAERVGALDIVANGRVESLRLSGSEVLPKFRTA